ncbi:ubiquitin domain-containing protein UBFD1-like [Anneissia japonica]|uniref:ubiquitin domain-containing protein UBFD1-like n=1 Tax=Anneissia japonica TaxID=1529436 RepID=UPI001425A3FD|nr:ubiquitin domain-containing protein UBFD1-like [Anneissia japonica]XP_033117831.1 ubiquitin domain-containing protein UBFD1-like [Anneissia japonica]
METTDSEQISTSENNSTKMETCENVDSEKKNEGAGDTDSLNTQDSLAETMKTESQCVPEDQKTENGSSQTSETVTFKLVYMKKNYDITYELDSKISQLKTKIQTLTEVPPAMQKLMYKGLVKDDQTLREAKVTNGAKMMMIGSTLKDVLTVNTTPSASAVASKVDTAPSKEPLSRQKLHKKVLDKGKPEDIMPGIKNKKESLPTFPISGMYNKAGGKVRLTFKLEVDQLWIGTKERTEKLKMESVKKVISEPIEGHEEYHIMALQLGPTEASRYWIYWVPAQYVDSIKDAVLGKWQSFF